MKWRLSKFCGANARWVIQAGHQQVWPCQHTFQLDYTKRGYKPGAKAQILGMMVNGLGIREKRGFFNRTHHHVHIDIRRPGRDITRRRSLYLKQVVWLDITLLKTTLSVEIGQFLDWLAQANFFGDPKYPRAGSSKVTSEVFDDFFCLSLAALYLYFIIHRWKGFRVWATCPGVLCLILYISIILEAVL